MQKVALVSFFLPLFLSFSISKAKIAIIKDQVEKDQNTRISSSHSQKWAIQRKQYAYNLVKHTLRGKVKNISFSLKEMISKCDHSGSKGTSHRYMKFFCSFDITDPTNIKWCYPTNAPTIMKWCNFFHFIVGCSFVVSYSFFFDGCFFNYF